MCSENTFVPHGLKKWSIADVILGNLAWEKVAGNENDQKSCLQIC